MKFSELGLTEPLLRAVEAAGYTTPTPIQADAIPPLLAGRDVLGIAQTGTGKTAAFMLPLLHSLAGLPQRAAPGRPHAVILAPTRELATQINTNLRDCAKFLRLSSLVVVGGVPKRFQVNSLRRGIDIVVATPGRLIDLMNMGAVRLSDVVWAVQDEADQMMDLGFLPALRQILSKMPRERQAALFSATMPAPIRALADEFLKDPQEVSVAPAAHPAATVTQTVMRVPSHQKAAKLVELLADPEVASAIVFTRTKAGADRVAEHLQQNKIAAGVIHGDCRQSERQRTLKNFKAGKLTVLVATDIAARGLDIKGVSHVFNYELPNVPESYVHRIGRTGRAGATGVAISLCDDRERNLLRSIERLTKQSLFTWPDSGSRGPSSRQNRKPGGTSKHRQGGKPRQGQGAKPRHAQGGKPGQNSGTGRRPESSSRNRKPSSRRAA